MPMTIPIDLSRVFEGLSKQHPPDQDELHGGKKQLPQCEGQAHLPLQPSEARINLVKAGSLPSSKSVHEEQLSQ